MSQETCRWPRTNATGGVLPERFGVEAFDKAGSGETSRRQRRVWKADGTL
jgi:hypothetical protein